MPHDLQLRPVLDDDLSIFFDQQLDPDANYMAAFTAKDPTDRAAFMAHWQRILASPTVIVRTVVVDGAIVGSVLSYEEDGRPEVSYWLGKPYWGQGIATRALVAFLADVNRTRPIYARAAKDNVGSLRVLAKCGFAIVGADKGYANARGTEIEEYVLALPAGQ